MTPAKSTSLTLLERVRAKDGPAWERLLNLYSPLVFHWCHRWGVHGDDADDVRQEVFQAVAVNLPTFRHDRPGDTFRGWLRGIARNKLLDHYRHREKQPEAPGGTDAYQQLQQVPDAETHEPDDSEQAEVGRLYHRALELVRGEFEERSWQMFWRAAVDGHAPVDIATDMGVTAAAVRKAKSRVLHRLREEVGDLLDAK